jgi:hypothetical protein
MRVGHHIGNLKLRALIDGIIFKVEENVLIVERNRFCKLNHHLKHVLASNLLFV